MRYPGFCGSFYTSQSVVSDAERTVNWYVEQLESQYAANRFALYPCPGFSPFVSAGQITEQGVRALKAITTNTGTRVFAVVGSAFYELFMDGTATKRNSALAMSVDAFQATISYNGASGGQLLITSGSNGYLFALSTNTFSQIAFLTGIATMGAMSNGIFLAFNQATGIVQFSNINDGSTWPALNNFARSLRPDPWQAMVIGPDFKPWFIGTETSEIWGFFGTTTNPFAPLVGAVIPYGTTAPWSVHTADDQIKWLSQTSLGNGIFVTASGWKPERISTHATAFQWSNFQRSSTIADAECFPYQDQDHPFSVMNFASANSTFVTDGATNQWHERGYFSSGAYQVGKARVHCFAWGKHLVGDRATATISTMDITLTTESDGSVIRRMRQAPGLINEHRFIRYPRLELLIESGLGTQTGQGSNPKIAMQYSDDGGHTWSDERLCSAGRAGDFTNQVYWDRNGVSRHRVFRVICTDPIPWRITDAYLNNRLKNGQIAA